jgi:hypothetical protein
VDSIVTLAATVSVVSTGLVSLAAGVGLFVVDGCIFRAFKRDNSDADASASYGFHVMYETKKGVTRLEHLKEQPPQLEDLKKRHILIGHPRLLGGFVHTKTGVGCRRRASERMITGVVPRLIVGVQGTWNTKVTGIGEVLFAYLSVVALVIDYTVYNFGNIGTVISVLNAVVFQEESSSIIEFDSMVWEYHLFSFQVAVVLFSLQVHIAIPALYDVLNVSVSWLRPLFAMIYCAVVCYQQYVLLFEMNRNVTLPHAHSNLLAKAFTVNGARFSLDALYIALAEKTGNFELMVPSHIRMKTEPEELELELHDRALV